jgi:hypothetical protein
MYRFTRTAIFNDIDVTVARELCKLILIMVRDSGRKQCVMGSVMCHILHHLSSGSFASHALHI